MAAVTVLVTGAGAPGIAGTLHALRHNWEQRELRLLCADMRADVVGRYLADGCHVLPRAREPGFLPALLELCRRERVDVLLPQVTAELALLAGHKHAFEREGVKVAVSDSEPIERTVDKYELSRVASQLGLAVPACVLVDDFSSLERAARELGYPGTPFAVKQPCGNGMRGYRAVFAGLDRKQAFYEEKPDSSRCTLDELHAILGDRFPPLMVMEYLPGTEYSVDVLASRERVHVVLPRERSQIRSGITFEARVCRDARLIGPSEQLASALGLTYAFGFQFKQDAAGTPKLLECNPRVQGTMVVAALAGANVIYGAVKLALGEALPEFEPRWSTTFLRYWGGVAVCGDESVRV